MKVITKRDYIRSVADRWRKQYPPTARVVFGPTDSLEKSKKLGSLPLDATEEQVAEIIGNRTWTRLECVECEQDVSKVIQLGDHHYCQRCLDRAKEQLEEAE